MSLMLSISIDSCSQRRSSDVIHTQRDSVCSPLFHIDASFLRVLLGYRSQRAGAAGGGVFAFSGGYAEAQQRQAENAARQAKEYEEYKQRVRDFGMNLSSACSTTLTFPYQSVNRPTSSVKLTVLHAKKQGIGHVLRRRRVVHSSQAKKVRVQKCVDGLKSSVSM
jgi:hypothetical protein